MDIRKLLVVPAVAGALALGACGGEEEAGYDEGVGAVEGEFGGVGSEQEGIGAAEGGVVGGTEILGNGIDDDGDGLIDEEA